MPLTDLGSYVPTMDEVVLHWADVDAELGGAPASDLKLEGGFSRADLIAARDVFESLNISIEDLENGREIAAANRDNLKGTLRQKLGQFRGMVRALIPKSKYAAATPTLPNFRADESSSSARSTTQPACGSELTPTPRWRDSLRLCSLPVRHRTGDDAGCV